MDGNGRWATQQGLSRIKGHIAGAKQVKNIISHANDVSIEALTIWGYSTDNWKRSEKEVNALMSLFNRFIIKETDELVEKNVQVSFIGNRFALPEQLQKVMGILEEKTYGNTGMKLQIALNYGGVDELVRAVKKVKINDLEVSKETIFAVLDTAGISDPDIVIRTGMPTPKDGLSIWRSSGFLPYQSIQSLCVSTEILWPDFTPEHFDKVIAYAKPDERLYGAQR